MLVPALNELSRRPARYAICTSCHGPAAPGRRRCWSCLVVGSQLPLLPRIVPLFLFELGTPVHRTLTGYKAAITPARRAACSAAFSGLLERWLGSHRTCLLGEGGRAIVVPVPSSTGGRPSWSGRHPLEELGRSAVDALAWLRVEPLLAPGDLPPARLRARADGYEVPAGADLEGRAVVVLDDMLVSGARLASAAAALTAAGARVLAAVPLGRLVRPGHNDATRAFWEDRRQTSSDAEVCALCAPRPRAGAVPMRSAGVSQRLAA